MKTINDINNANRAMWDSGEFRHSSDTRHPATPPPRHPATGGQQVARGEQVVTSHDDVSKKQVHLPRNAGRRWRGSSWDGTDTSTIIEDAAPKPPKSWVEAGKQVKRKPLNFVAPYSRSPAGLSALNKPAKQSEEGKKS